MANIPEFTTPESAVYKPNESGAETVARTGQRLGQMAGRLGQMTREAGTLKLRSAQAIESGFKSLGVGIKDIGTVVENHQAQTEVSNGTQILANTHNDLDTQWAKARGDADPSQTVGPDFLTKTAFPALDKVVESAATPKARAHLQSMVDNAKLHYAQSTHMDDMAAAGDNVIRNMQNVIDTATRRSQADITSVDYNGQMIAQSFEGAIKSGNFDAKTQIKLRDEQSKAVRENALAGIKGAIDRNPFQAKADLAGLAAKYNLGGKEVEALQHYARAQERAHVADANNAAIAADLASKKQGEAYMQRMMNSWKEDENGQIQGLPKAQDVLNDPHMTVEQRTSMYHFLTGISDRGNVAKIDNPETYGNLRARVGADDNPATVAEVAQRVHEKQITPASGKELINDIVKGPKTGEDKTWQGAEKNAVSQIKGGIHLDPTSAGFNPGSPYQLGAAQKRVEEIFKQARQSGTKMDDVLDPTSKAYFMRDPTLREILKDPNKYDPKNLGTKKGVQVDETKGNNGGKPSMDKMLLDSLGLGKK